MNAQVQLVLMWRDSCTHTAERLALPFLLFLTGRHYGNIMNMFYNLMEEETINLNQWTYFLKLMNEL